MVGEARHYGLLGNETQGAHTELLKQHQKPLEALEMRLDPADEAEVKL